MIRDALKSGQGKFRIPDDIILFLLLTIGLVNGVLYVFIVPPWQHYDEPAHFEYAWIKATCHDNPKECIDPVMRQQIVDSMVETNFYFKISGSPASNPNFEPTWIFVDQFEDPPLYHYFVGLPIKWFPDLDVVTLMYIMRLVTASFLLISIWAAWGAAGEITQPGHMLRWMAPLFVALLPGFTTVMTAVNNDGLVIALFSLFIWLSLRLIRRFNLIDLLMLLIVSGLTVFTKKAGWIILMFLLIAIVLAVLPEKSKRWGWVGLGFSLVVAMSLIFRWGDAAFWYRMTPQEELTKVELSPSHAQGETAIQLSLSLEESTSPSVWQHLPIENTDQLRGHSAQIGGWMWASSDITVRTPGFVVIYPNRTSPLINDVVTLSTTPQFVSMNIDFPDNTDRILVSLSPQLLPVKQSVTVFYTGLYLFEGSCPNNEKPEFTNPLNKSGEWCGRQVKNLIRNGAGLDEGVGVRPSVYSFIRTLSPSYERGLVSGLGYLLDPIGNSWYNKVTPYRILTTFWAVFGWGQVHLTSGWIYNFMGILSGILVISAVVLLLRNQKKTPGIILNKVAYLVIVGLVGWITAYLGGFYFGGLFYRLVLPVARYGFPVIVPSAIVLCTGWYGLFTLFPWRIVSQVLSAALFIVALIALDIYAITTIQIYFR
ncbi:MAG: DUF2142 domain-containing protein [Bellilinea sp.]